MADVLIAGGGIAGSSLAIILGRAGVTVDLFEASHFPREKPCGEGLMPAGVAVLRRLGLDASTGGQPLRGVRYHGWGRVAEANFPLVAGRPVVAVGQRRLLLDQALFEAAQATPGVQVHQGAAVAGAVIEEGRAVGLRVGGSEHRAGLVVAADGPLSPVRRSLGLDGPRPRHNRVGFRTHFRLPQGRVQPDVIEVFMGSGHELYVTPLPNDEVLVAGLSHPAVVGGDARAALTRWIDAQPVLRERLAGAEPLTPLAGRSPLALRARAGLAPGAVLLGDAAGFIDPITAGGMAQALVTAELLGTFIPRVLAEGRGGDRWLRRFDRRRRRLLRDYHLLTHFMLFLVARPILARAMLALMQRTPSTMSHLIGVAGGVRGLLGGAR
ncbi:MAG TPA: NAD(P)/FAD-dependent oxidoreductase [Polyangia bacterium]|jgi:flavin-dependent dehydrogenase|nr:NAD(P)/FAD-dependent oxidoreductase [Polyangia bacterium]